MKKLVTKTNGNGDEYFVEINKYEDGFRKYRNPMKHLKPKKKKRK